MPLPNLVGRTYPPFTVEVEKRWIRSFVKAVGDANPVYTDEAAARAAGFRGIPVPPTFPFVITLEGQRPERLAEDLGVAPARLLHAEQAFDWKAPICAGDVITGRQTVVEQYEKKGGELSFVVTETHLYNQWGEGVCELRTTVVVRMD